MSHPDPVLLDGSPRAMIVSQPGPTVAEVVRFEDPPLGSRGTRRAVVRWSRRLRERSVALVRRLMGMSA
jgi:hypothetical protein